MRSEVSMRPSTYFKFDGDSFFHAVNGHGHAVTSGYLRALWYYRSHNHCRGLENKSEFLRKICACEKDEWKQVEPVIFDNEFFFVMDENGLWHQKRAEEDYKEDCAAYERAVKRSHKANAKRWGKKKKK